MTSLPPYGLLPKLIRLMYGDDSQQIQVKCRRRTMRIFVGVGLVEMLILIAAGMARRTALH